MYEILQLNDMLVPELHDIAEQLAIPNFKKLEKQDLVNKIIEKQTVSTTETTAAGEKPKRKRIIKPIEAPEEQAKERQKVEPKAEVKAEAKPEHKPIKRVEIIAEKKKAVHRKPEPENEDDEEDLQPITSEQSTIPAAIASLLQEEDDIQQQQPELQKIGRASCRERV